VFEASRTVQHLVTAAVASVECRLEPRRLPVFRAWLGLDVLGREVSPRCYFAAGVRRLCNEFARWRRLSTSNGICEEYRLLEEQLASALRLCAEYESPFVFPIDSRSITLECLDELRAEAAKEKRMVESRIFVHRSICRVCLHSA
jgi:hypothetical protein